MPAKKNTILSTIPNTIPVPRSLVDACRAMLAALEARDAVAQQSAAETMAAILIPPTDPGEMIDTLKISKIERRTSSGGSWVSGSIAGHDFEALVFSEHAENPEWELDNSRISKLCIQEHFTHRQVVAFERGWDMRPTTDAARQITDLLSAGLAETVYGK